MQARRPFSGSTIVLSKLKAFPKAYQVGLQNKVTTRGPWHALVRLARRKFVEFLFRGKSYRVHIFKWANSMRLEYVPSAEVTYTSLAPLQLVVRSPSSLDVYLDELHKTLLHTGSELVNFAVELSRKLGAAKITLVDAATISCNPNHAFMDVNLALINALQGKPTFYERLGFVHTNQDAIKAYRSTASEAGKTSMKHLVETLQEFVKLARKVKATPDDYELVKPNISWPMHPFVTPATRDKAEHIVKATRKLVELLVGSLVLNSTVCPKSSSFGSSTTKSPLSPMLGGTNSTRRATSKFADCTLSDFVVACMRRQDCATITRLFGFQKATLGVRLKSSLDVVVYPTLFTKLYLMLPWYPHELEQAL